MFPGKTNNINKAFMQLPFLYQR